MNTTTSSRRTKRILIAVADRQLSESIRVWLEEGLEDVRAYVPLVDAVENEVDARQRLKAQRYHLVVTQISIPADRKSPRNDKENRGLELVRSLQAPTSSILLAPCVDSSLYDATRGFYKCVPLAPDLGLEEHLVRHALELLSSASIETVEERVRITFTLNADSPLAGSCCIEGIGFSFRFVGPIQIDKKTMTDLINKSKGAEQLTKYPSWETYLREIGEQLLQKLFIDNYMLYEYARVAGRADRKTEIVFDIGKGDHPIFFETLLDPESLSRAIDDGGKTFWMLKAPIYRRLRVLTDNYPLFQGGTRQAPTNCLIIESQVDGVVQGMRDEEGQPLTLQRLPNVPVEGRWLEDYLQGHRREFGLGEILRISADRLADSTVNRSGKNTMKEWVHNELTRSDVDWHLVHYAGHCHYDEASGKGYVFFPGEALGEGVDLFDFSAWLSRARFVYLSGCNSSEENFVFELAHNHVPAVLGFRWKIEDGPAARYTQAFYVQLFEVHRSLEYAFLAARLQLRAGNEKKRTWASPMLIMQLSNSHGAMA